MVETQQWGESTLVTISDGRPRHHATGDHIIPVYESP